MGRKRDSESSAIMGNTAKLKSRKCPICDAWMDKTAYYWLCPEHDNHIFAHTEPPRK